MNIFVCVMIFFSSVSFADLLGPHGSHGNKISNPDNWMAIVGDSGATGAASSREIEPTVSSLRANVMSALWGSPVSAGSSEDVLTRVPYSRGEYNEAGWFARWGMNLGAKLALRLDVSENSFGYQVGLKRGVRPSDIVLVGQDGVMVKTIADQFARIFEMRTKTLPPLVLVSFTANDFCDEHVFESSPEEWAANFESALKKAWSDAKPFLIPHPKGTRILVLAPFDVVNVITNPGIMEQTTNVEGQGAITCGQLRHGETRFTLSSWFVLRMLNLMCPSVTKTHPGDLDRLDHLRAVQSEFGEAWKRMLLRLSGEHTGIQWSYLEGIRDLKFGHGDVRNDCFHPSASGAAKLADYILNSQAFE